MSSAARYGAENEGALADRARWSDRWPQFAVIALGFLFIAVVWLGVFLLMQERERAAFQQAEHDVASLAATLEEQVERTILGVDQIMRFAQSAYEADPANFDLRAWLDKVPFLRSLALQISLVDSDGNIVASNLQIASGPQANIADRDHFRFHLGQSASGLYVSRPVLGRVSKRWSIQLSRRINGADGALAGVLVVSLDPDYFARLFRTADPGKDSSIMLLGRDGFVRARVPEVAGLFERRLGGQLDQIRACVGEALRPAESCRLRSPVDGVERVVGIRWLEELPLMVVVGKSAEVVSAQLYQARRRELGLAALLTLALVAALVFLVRQLEQQLQREAELRDSQARLRRNTACLAATLDNIDQGLMMVDANKHIQVCNRRAMELLELPQSLIEAGATFEDLGRYQVRSGEFDAGMIEPGWDPLAPEPGASRVYERRRPNGRILEIRTNRLADGSAVRTYSDVTARRTAEIAMRESEERYRAIAEHLPQKVWMIRPDGTAVYFNKAMTAYHGEVGTAAVERLDLFHPDDAQRVTLMRERCFVTQSAFTVEVRMKRHDGAYRWHYMTLLPLKRDGQIFEWVGTSLDIDDIRQAEAKLRASEERLAFALDASNDGLWDWNIQTGHVWYSDRWQTMLGFEPGEIAPVLASRDANLHPEDSQHVGDMLRSHLEGRTAVYEAEHRIRRKNGSWMWILDRGKVVSRDESGQPLRMVGTQTDVTARKEAESAAEAARIEAERESEAKTEFLASMSHEIRTPLNSILGFTGLILDRPDLDPEVMRQVHLIQGSGAALLTIVNDILDFSKIEAGQIDLDPHSFGTEALIGNTLSIVRGLAGAKRLAICAEIDPDLPPWLVGDEDRLRQILLNFLNNAIKFTREGHVTLAVRREATSPEGETIRFSVVDTGIGIPTAKQDRLFQRFSQVDGSIRREFGGTGLGLAISKRLVELMGGTIGVESEERQGSTFWFTITLPRGEPGAGASSVSSGVATARRKARILLAEDVEVNQEIARAVLESAGHSVDVVSDGSEAVMAVQERAYDLVLMDVQMPLVDGVMATHRIRELDGPARDVPIIAMTANVLPEQVAKFRRAGMNGHVGKPFKRDELYGAIERALNRTGPEMQAVSASPATASVDPEVFEGLREIMGQAGIGRLLDTLEERLKTLLAGMPGRSADRQGLARDAHTLVSACGMLGFLPLSGLFRELEEACLRDDELAPALQRLRVAVQTTLGEIAALKEAA
jgi:PAS domain S-box-containing protein